MTTPPHDPASGDARPPRRARLLLDRALSASAGLVALTALGVSLYQTHLMREQQRLSAWPSLWLFQSTADGYSRRVQNVGLGPALIRSVVVTVDGQPRANWGEVAVALIGEPAVDSLQRGGAHVTTSTLRRGSVLLPGEPFTMLELGPPAAARPMERAARGRLAMSICYCSFYRECWIARTGEPEPAQVDACATASREFDD